MTAEEFSVWTHRPENDSRWFELVRGEVIEQPRPTRPQSVVSARISSLLCGYAESRGGLYVTCRAGTLLRRDPDTVRGPDVAVFDDAARFEDLHPLYGEVPPRLAILVPNLEVRFMRLMSAVEDYLRADIRLVWVVHYDTQDVSIFAPHGYLNVLGPGDEITGLDVLPGFRCRVADFFRLPGEKPAAPTS
jgi:Uma2 family endonuclease